MPALQNFNANEVEPNTGFDAIPPGKYKVVIEATEEKATKNGNGSYIQFTLVVVEGEYANRKLWDRLNLNNPNEKAVQIARGTLSAICRAVGITQPKDTEQLHDIPLIARVGYAKPDPNDPNGEKRNEIKGYEEAKGTLQTAKPVPQQQAAAPGKAPWKR